MINVSQAFHRTSAQPIDDSITLTKAQMLAVNDNLMPRYYFTICQDDGKLYLYDKNAAPSGTTGKFSEFDPGSHTQVNSPDDSIQVTSDTVGNQIVYHIVMPNRVTAGTYTKLTVNAQGIVIGAALLEPSDIPDLDASKIASGTLNPGRIGDATIGSSKIAQNAVGTGHLQDQSVTTQKMALHSVDASRLAEDAVGTENLQDQSVTNEKIKDNTIDPSKMDLRGILPLVAGIGIGALLDGGTGILTLFSRIYMGIVTLEISGSYAINSPTPGQPYPYVSNEFSDGTTTRANTHTVNYKEANDHPAISHPTFEVDENGHLIMSLGGVLQRSLLFDFTAYMHDLVGMLYGDVAYWNDDSPNVRFQLIGALHRIIPCAGGAADYILNTRPMINAPNVATVSSAYKITMIASYLYASEQ